MLQAEDNVESLQNQLERCSRAGRDLEEENKNLHYEYEQVGGGAIEGGLEAMNPD